MTNKHRCPPQLWAKMSIKDRAKYNRFMDSTEDSNLIFPTNVMRVMDDKTWNTIRHNLYVVGWLMA